MHQHAWFGKTTLDAFSGADGSVVLQCNEGWRGSSARAQFSECLVRDSCLLPSTPSLALTVQCSIVLQ